MDSKSIGTGADFIPNVCIKVVHTVARELLDPQWVLLRSLPKDGEILNADKWLRTVGRCEAGAGGLLHLNSLTSGFAVLCQRCG